jgi:hypothetical protein
MSLSTMLFNTIAALLTANQFIIFQLVNIIPIDQRVILQTKQTPWPESASELYRLSDCRLSAKLVPTFVDRGVSRSQRGGTHTAVITVF